MTKKKTGLTHKQLVKVIRKLIWVGHSYATSSEWQTRRTIKLARLNKHSQAWLPPSFSLTYGELQEICQLLGITMKSLL